MSAAIGIPLDISTVDPALNLLLGPMIGDVIHWGGCEGRNYMVEFYIN